MKITIPGTILLATGAMWGLVGCSQAVYVRVFNGTDHPIRLLTEFGGTSVEILPGQSQRGFLTSITQGHDHGFAIVDGSDVRFYVAASHAEDGRLIYPAPLSLLKTSRKPGAMTPEYFVEYTSNSSVFALDASAEASPKRLNPQPPGFPIEPNKSWETTSVSRPAVGKVCRTLALCNEVSPL